VPLSQTLHKRHYIEQVINKQLDSEEEAKAQIDRRHHERIAAQRLAEQHKGAAMAARSYERLAQQHETRDRILAALKAKQVRCCAHSLNSLAGVCILSRVVRAVRGTPSRCS
jgi:uncharacterized membrane protein YheB (UPF0754 family)